MTLTAAAWGQAPPHFLQKICVNIDSNIKIVN